MGAEESSSGREADIAEVKELLRNYTKLEKHGAALSALVSKNQSTLHANMLRQAQDYKGIYANVHRSRVARDGELASVLGAVRSLSTEVIATTNKVKEAEARAAAIALKLGVDVGRPGSLSAQQA